MTALLTTLKVISEYPGETLDDVLWFPPGLGIALVIIVLVTVIALLVFLILKIVERFR